ncbi:MAG: DRTGG domain-containing protein [Candidatus Aminicenantes bacterium]|nr:DRTGG domain-containing protein [Candidatus Aminicenantes bacterium]
MKLREIKELLAAEVIWGENHLEIEIDTVCASDLMSDVLALGKPGMLLITGLSNVQSVRTADIIEAKAILYVRGKKPDQEGISLAKKKGIPLLATKYLMYQACGLLYQKGLKSVHD